MKGQLIYRTYILKLWLSTMILAPLAFLLFILIANSALLSDIDSGPLDLAVDLILFLIFIVPTFLFFAVLSLIIPSITKDPKKLRLLTILISLLGEVVTFLSIYDSYWYDQNQLIWGLLLAFIYGASLVFFGIIYKVEI